MKPPQKFIDWLNKKCISKKKAEELKMVSRTIFIQWSDGCKGLPEDLARDILVIAYKAYLKGVEDSKTKEITQRKESAMGCHGPKPKPKPKKKK
jgi:hypothetical protein